jgi:hypothetical protein
MDANGIRSSKQNYLKRENNILTRLRIVIVMPGLIRPILCVKALLTVTALTLALSSRLRYPESSRLLRQGRTDKLKACRYSIRGRLHSGNRTGMKAGPSRFPSHIPIYRACAMEDHRRIRSRAEIGFPSRSIKSRDVFAQRVADSNPLKIR